MVNDVKINKSRRYKIPMRMWVKVSGNHDKQLSDPFQTAKYKVKLRKSSLCNNSLYFEKNYVTVEYLHEMNFDIPFLKQEQSTLHQTSQKLSERMLREIIVLNI